MRNARYYAPGPLPETPSPKKAPGSWEKTRVVGQPVTRVDAYE